MPKPYEAPTTPKLTPCRCERTDSDPDLIPQHRVVAGRLAEHLGRVVLVDVAHQPRVDAVADQATQPGREARRGLAGDAELLFLLLADPARAVVHGDTDPTLVGLVGAAAVPKAAVPDQDA